MYDFGNTIKYILFSYMKSMEYARVHFSIISCRNQNISFGTFGRKMNNLVLFTVCREHNETLSRTFMEDLIETYHR
jgi:hypothetical protein